MGLHPPKHSKHPVIRALPASHAPARTDVSSVAEVTPASAAPLPIPPPPPLPAPLHTALLNPFHQARASVRADLPTAPTAPPGNSVALQAQLIKARQVLSQAAAPPLSVLAAPAHHPCPFPPLHPAWWRRTFPMPSCPARLFNPLLPRPQQFPPLCPSSLPARPPLSPVVPRRCCWSALACSPMPFPCFLCPTLPLLTSSPPLGQRGPRWELQPPLAAARTMRRA